MKNSLKLLCLFLLLLCVGCASPKKIIAPEDYCVPPAYTITSDKEAPIEIDAEEFALNKKLFKGSCLTETFLSHTLLILINLCWH